MKDWLLFLGAGASRPAPTLKPPFVPLSSAILAAIGWIEIERTQSEIDRGLPRRWRYGQRPYYPDIADLDSAPEVLFGTLAAFGVRFAAEVCRVLSDAEPNAVHEVAARVLEASGCVWTPNIDDAVEAACRAIKHQPHRTGRASPSLDNPLAPLVDTRAGSYVKFHGTVEAASTLAFTDRELIAPLDPADTKLLIPLAANRVVVFYGYAGADADLADLLDDIIDNAREIWWFEPSKRSYERIVEAFPRSRSRIRFVPHWSDPAAPTDAAHMANAFLDLAALYGHHADPDLKRLLIGNDPRPEDKVEPDELNLSLDEPSGATQARLVERFGANDPNDDAKAWALAWREDIRSHPKAIPAHVRYRIRRSLYHAGSVSAAVDWFGAHRSFIRAVEPRRVRDALITRAEARLLHDPDWTQLSDFVKWAISTRANDGNPYPVDLYYQAQAYRNALQPREARDSAERAVVGLEGVSERERLAGALYEAGDAAIYQADFSAALGYAFQLRFRRGRYAIPRWQAWGAWLEAVACAHIGDIDSGSDAHAAAKARFDYEREPLNIADARTAELLIARVRLARTGVLGISSLDDSSDAGRVGRHCDDLDLLRADISIALAASDTRSAQDHLEDARRRLERVRTSYANPVALAWARLGLAELARLDEPNDPAVADAFESLVTQACECGALWLEAQALLGLQLCDQGRASPLWQQLATRWPAAGGVSLDELRATPTDPARVLWLLTI